MTAYHLIICADHDNQVAKNFPLEPGQECTQYTLGMLTISLGQSNKLTEKQRRYLAQPRAITGCRNFRIVADGEAKIQLPVEKPAPVVIDNRKPQASLATLIKREVKTRPTKKTKPAPAPEPEEPAEENTRNWVRRIFACSKNVQVY
jgi:hypothetical protein